MGGPSERWMVEQIGEKMEGWTNRSKDELTKVLQIGQTISIEKVHWLRYHTYTIFSRQPHLPPCKKKSDHIFTTLH